MQPWELLQEVSTQIDAIRPGALPERFIRSTGPTQRIWDDTDLLLLLRWLMHLDHAAPSPAPQQSKLLHVEQPYTQLAPRKAQSGHRAGGGVNGVFPLSNTLRRSALRPCPEARIGRILLASGRRTRHFSRVRARHFSRVRARLLPRCRWRATKGMPGVPLRPSGGRVTGMMPRRRTRGRSEMRRRRGGSGSQGSLATPESRGRPPSRPPQPRQRRARRAGPPAPRAQGSASCWAAPVPTAALSHCRAQHRASSHGG
jgi:hypothetical protein